MDKQSFQLQVSRMSIEQAACLQRLMQGNAGYSRRLTGSGPAPDAAMQVLAALPPKVQAEQKNDLGLWEGADLVGFADLILGWPRTDTVHIGLLMVDGDRQGQGWGRQLNDAVLELMREYPPITVCRISIVDANAAVAEPFWKSLGYEPTGEASDYAAGDKQGCARVWSRPVSSMRREHLYEQVSG